MTNLDPKTIPFKRLMLLCLIIFLSSFSLSSYSIYNKRQLGKFEGMAEEYFLIAYDIHITGKAYSQYDIDYMIYRPPGFIYFMTGIFRLFDIKSVEEMGITTREGAKQYGNEIKKTIAYVHGFLFAATAVIIFLWLIGYCNLANAFILSFLYGCNPYSIIAAGMTHYQSLHVFCFVLSGYLWSLSFRNKFKGIKTFIAGILWGITTLIRPTTLILPVIAFPIYFFNKTLGFKNRLALFFMFCLGMTLTVAPYTLRNYIWTKKIIPVNAQTWDTLWAATEKHSPPNPNHYNWWDVMNKKGAAIYKRTLDVDRVDNLNYWKNIHVLEEAYKKEALENLKERPGIYLENFIQNFKTYNLHINSVLVKFFEIIQDPTIKVPLKRLLETGNPQDVYSSLNSDIFKWFVYCLQFFSFWALLLALRFKDSRMIIPVAIYGCFCLAHCITYMDFMYYYVKVPLLFLLSGYTLAWIERKWPQFGFLPLGSVISVSKIFLMMMSVCILGLDYFLFIK